MVREEYRSAGSNLVVVYERRVGRTSLVSKFLGNNLSNFTGINVMFSSWYAAFDLKKIEEIIKTKQKY